jgi:hypothetical protein
MLVPVWVVITLLAANQLTEQSPWRTYMLVGLAAGMCLWMSILGRRALSRELSPDKSSAAEPSGRATRGR